MKTISERVYVPVRIVLSKESECGFCHGSMPFGVEATVLPCPQKHIVHEACVESVDVKPKTESACSICELS
jgi:hypothetical protein